MEQARHAERAWRRAAATSRPLLLRAHLDRPAGLLWEFELPRRPQDTRAGWPDLATVWSDRIVLYELKTEAGSVREGQVDWYLDLGRHHHPDRQVDLVYLTSDPIAGQPPAAERSQYRNITWGPVADLIREIWSNAPFELRSPALTFADYLTTQFPGAGTSQGGAAAEGPAGGGACRRPPEPVERVLEAAANVARTGAATAIGGPWPSLEAAQLFRTELRRQLEAAAEGDPALALVQPWVWRRTTGGPALTAEGEMAGIEVRLSRKRAA